MKMGNSIPNQKEREKICIKCPAKCEGYIKSKHSSYSPKKSHKIGALRFSQDALYQFCMHYDISKGLEEVIQKTYSSAG